MSRFSQLSRFAILGVCVVALSGCVNREQADAILVKGCMAGVGSLLPEGETTGEIKDKSFSPSSIGPGMRYVKITTTAADGWLEEANTFECIFDESFGLFNSNYVASIYQLRFGDQVYGKSGNEIQGSFDDFLKLTDAIRKAMYE